MEITIKKLSPAIFVIILICFFLPFVSASCGGQKLATLSGVQLVTGTTVEGARPSEDIFRAEKATQKVDTEPLAIAALITTLVGLGYLSMDIDGFCGCCNPVNFAMLPDGRFVTCEKGLPRVKIYDADGTFSGVVAGPEAFRENESACSLEGLSNCQKGGLDVAVDSQGRVLVMDPIERSVRIFTRI